MLESIIAALRPEELEERKRDAAEIDAEDVGDRDMIPGGFAVWQEVAASRDLMVGDRIMATFGTKGVVVMRGIGENRLRVNFDELLDNSDLCLNVTPAEIVAQLPQAWHICIGQRVVAAQDLMFGPEVGVRFGVKGTVLAQHGPDRICVSFDERVDGTRTGVNVLPAEIRPHCRLPGGFDYGQSVFAANDLFANEVLLVLKGTHGVIRDKYSYTRISIKFDVRQDGLRHWLNVTPGEIVASPPVA